MSSDIALQFPEVLEPEMERQLQPLPVRAAGDNGPEGLRFPDDIVFRGYAAPVRIEGDVRDLEVEGAIPPGLNGTYYRNCADHRYPPMHGKDIFLNGDGMIHMLRIEDGHADLKTRYVRTDRYKAESAARRSLFGHYRNPFFDDPSVKGLDRGTANTSVVRHAGRFLALKEDSRPTELHPDTLETIGSYDFGGQLKSKTFTAHPKIDPKTGEMIAYGYNTEGVSSDEVQIFWISPGGELTRTEVLRAPYCSMIHDFLVSEHYVIFTICPMVNDTARVKRGEPFFHWDSERPTMIGVFPRKEGVSHVRWWKSPVTGLETHTFNAWEEGSRLHVEHFFTRSGWLSQFPDLRNPEAHEQPPFAERWTFDLDSNAEAFEAVRMFDHIGEMPVVDPRFLMSRCDNFFFGTTNKALGPMVEFGPKGPPFTCLGHYEESTGRLDFYYAGPNSTPEEPCFVPKSKDAAEGDGWLLSIVGRRAENRTDLVILDARNLSAGPVATLKMPCRIHEGFHGIWVPTEA